MRDDNIVRKCKIDFTNKVLDFVNKKILRNVTKEFDTRCTLASKNSRKIKNI